MQKLISAGAVIAALSMIALMPAAAAAQQAAHSPEQRGEYDEIIIKRKGNDTGKITVEMNGSQVLINGKKPGDYKGGDVMVYRRKSDHEGNNAFAYNFNFPGSGANFDFPDNHAQIFAHPFADQGFDSNRALLGVYTDSAKTGNGAGVAAVSRGSAAADAGLQKGDVITKIDDRQIASPEDLVKTIGGYQPGDKISVTYLRGGKAHTADATLGKSSGFSYHSETLAPPGRSFRFSAPTPLPGKGFFHDFMFSDKDAPQLGMTVQEREKHEGVKVLEVQPGSAAAGAGFKAGDIITGFAGKKLSGVEDLRDALEANKDKGHVEARILREGHAKTLTVDIPYNGKTITL